MGAKAHVERERDRDLRWLWLAVSVAGTGVAATWFSQGGPLYSNDPSWAVGSGVAKATATTARFAVMLAMGAAIVETVAMLAAKRSHYLSGGTGLVCAVSGFAALAASALHMQTMASARYGTPSDWLPLALAAMGALTIGGFGLWRDARVEHKRAEEALDAVERDIHRRDGDLM